MKVTLACAVVVISLAAADASRLDTSNRVELFADDFSRFAPGLLSAPIGQLNGAIQEYHYIEHRGVPTHPWRNPIVHLDTWAAGDEEGKPYLEQHTLNTDTDRVAPLFVTGDPEWRDYRVEVSVRPLSLEKEAGLVFRYRTSRHYYRLALEGGERVRLALRMPLDEHFRVSADALSVGSFTGRPSGPVRAYVDGSDEGFLIFEADGTLVKHLGVVFVLSRTPWPHCAAT